MSKIEWTGDNLPSLGRIYLRSVLENMRGRDESVVRFGQTGQGIAPHYQVTLPNGVALTYRGPSHNPFEQADEFDVINLSQSLDLATIMRALEQA